jgi:chorismate synthase
MDGLSYPQVGGALGGLTHYSGVVIKVTAKNLSSVNGICDSFFLRGYIQYSRLLDC